MYLIIIQRHISVCSSLGAAAVGTRCVLKPMCLSGEAPALPQRRGWGRGKQLSAGRSAARLLPPLPRPPHRPAPSAPWGNAPSPSPSGGTGQAPCRTGCPGRAAAASPPPRAGLQQQPPSPHAAQTINQPCGSNWLRLLGGDASQRRLRFAARSGETKPALLQQQHR